MEIYEKNNNLTNIKIVFYNLPIDIIFTNSSKSKIIAMKPKMVNYQILLSKLVNVSF